MFDRLLHDVIYQLDLSSFVFAVLLCLNNIVMGLFLSSQIFQNVRGGVVCLKATMTPFCFL